MVDTFGWNLADLDRTDIESLLPFLFHCPEWKRRQKSGAVKGQQIFADQVNWL